MAGRKRRRWAAPRRAACTWDLTLHVAETPCTTESQMDKTLPRAGHGKTGTRSVSTNVCRTARTVNTRAVLASASAATSTTRLAAIARGPYQVGDERGP